MGLKHRVLIKSDLLADSAAMIQARVRGCGGTGCGISRPDEPELRLGCWINHCGGDTRLLPVTSIVVRTDENRG